MAHTYTNLLYHITFSTKDRAPLVDEELGARLFPYMGGILRELGGSGLAISGPADHVHVLAELPPTLAVSDAMRILKANSSRWVHEEWASRAAFGWQTGYAAFSVSRSRVDVVVKYVMSQKERHRRMTFQEELLALLRKHGVEYDERYIWE